MVQKATHTSGCIFYVTASHKNPKAFWNNNSRVHERWLEVQHCTFATTLSHCRCGSENWFPWRWHDGHKYRLQSCFSACVHDPQLAWQSFVACLRTISASIREQYDVLTASPQSYTRQAIPLGSRNECNKLLRRVSWTRLAVISSVLCFAKMTRWTPSPRGNQMH